MNSIIRRLRESRINEEKSSYEYIFRIPWREVVSDEYDEIEAHYMLSTMDYASDIMDLAEEDFNEIEWTDYTSKSSRTEDSAIESMKMSFTPEGDCFITVTTGIILDEDQVAKLISYLSGQMSDGWGEGFEQREIARYSDTDQEWIEDPDEDDGGYYDDVESYYYVTAQFWWADPNKPWDIDLVSAPSDGIKESYEPMKFPTEDEAYAYAEEYGYDIDKTQYTNGNCIAWLYKKKEYPEDDE